jgi:vitamin B12 transporter
MVSRMRVVVGGLLGITLAAAGRAETATDFSLDEVVVVATRAPQSLEKIGNSVTVLNDVDIRERQSNDLVELLASTPGINFSRNGGPGTATSISIRGADSDHTVVLIDGVVLNDPASPSGGLDFGNLLVGDISRIEILRGAQSTLYGSNALSGVINIETTQPHEGLGVDLQGEKGSLASGLLKGGIGGKWDKFSFRLSATWFDTDSVSSFDRQYGGVETDPYRNAVFSGRATYDFTPEVGLDLRAYYTKSKVANDGFPPPNFVFADEGDYQLSRQIVDYIGLHFDFFDGRWKNRLAYQYTITDRGDFTDDGTFVSHNDQFTGTNNRLEYQGTLEIAAGYRAVFGFQHEKYQLDSLPQDTGSHVASNDDSGYAQLQAEVIKGLNITAGERLESYESYGKHATGQLAAAWVLPSATVLRSSFGQGFKAPSLYQLYGPFGNPDVQAERSKHWDIGVEQPLLDNRLTVSATYFYIDFDNLIEFNDCPGSPLCTAAGHSEFGYYANLGKARSDGIELQASARITDALSVSGNYTHLKTEDRTPDSPTLGMQRFRHPENQANLQMTYEWPFKLTTSIGARYSGSSTDQNFNVFPAETLRLGSYTLWEARAAYALSDHVEVYARCDNCTGKRYEQVYQYGSWGRTLFAGGRIRY